MLSLSLPSLNQSNYGKAKIGWIYDSSSIGAFIRNLSSENWDNIFNSEIENDVNIIFNNFLNTYLTCK
jgi:hypothetical protein